MTAATVREISGDEAVDVLHELSNYAFRSSPPLADKETRREAMALRTGTRYWGVFEDGRPVANAGSSPLTQNLRCKLLPMAGIHNVTTDPSARRKGYARRMLVDFYAALHEQGFVLSCLYPFRESFYERLGYCNLPQTRKAIFAPEPLAPLLQCDLAGTVERFPLADAYDVYRDAVLRVRQQTHGMSAFDYYDWFGPRQSELWLALAKVAGEVAGLMIYDLKGEKLTQYTMNIAQLYYLSGQGKYLLLQWIAQHIDQACRIEIWLPPAEHPETWLDDLHMSAEAAWIAPMGRVLDVGGLNGVPAGPGHFSARITDATCPWNEGSWEFETVDGQLHAGRGGSADCELGIQGLSALVYGTPHPDDFAWRGWGNPSPAIQATIQQMFPPALPYLHATF